mgnify:CR=1 FL=1
MRLIVWVAAAVILGFLSFQIYRFYASNAVAGAELEKASSKLEELKKENEQLQADIVYYSEAENLAKELKARFDYKKPGEKLIKIQ